MMYSDTLQSSPVRTRHSIYSMLAPVPAACFVGALLTDLAYWRSEAVMWETFSIWLIAAGLVMAGVTAIVGLIEYVATARRHRVRPAWPHLFAGALAVLLSLANAFVHSRDGYTAVVPTGLILSGTVVLILLVSRLYRPGQLVAAPDGRIAATRRSAGLVTALTLVLFCAAMGSAFALAGSKSTELDPSAQIGANPTLPAPHQYFVPPIRIAQTTSWGPGETPTVAEGLKVQPLATGFMHPRSLYVLPNGDVLVVETNGPPAPIDRPKDIIMGLVQGYAGTHAPGANRITLLRDTKDGGAPQTREVFLDNLNSPFGVALVGHDFYVANTDAIMRYPYVEGQTTITAPGTKLTDLPGGPIDHHWTKSLVASADGSKLYVGIGSNSNITENGIGAELGRADIWEVDRATGAVRIYASGLRNPTGMSWEPQSGKLWAVVNERDELGDDLVPDYMTSVSDGGFYGWPYSYYGQHLDARVQPQRPDLVAQAIVPDYALSSHVAPLGIAFYTANGLPEAYHGGAFVGEHGSWDRNPLNGYKVVYVPFSGGHPNGPAKDVVTGFLNADKKARGRPVGLAVDRAGALLIADDLGNTVWRVTAASP